MNKRPAITKSAGVIREVYSHLCPIAAEIEKLRALVLADTTMPFGAWRDGCRSTFDGFYRCVRDHIDYEESTGVHAWLTGLSTPVAGRARELESEHKELLSECDRIASRLSAMSAFDGYVEREIVLRLENVIALFRRHTAAEMEIVHEALGDADLGESPVDLAQRTNPHTETYEKESA